MSNIVMPVRSGLEVYNGVGRCLYNGARESEKSSTFGQRTGVELSTVITSRRAYIKAASDAVITVTGGEYSVDGGDTWTSGASTRGTFAYLLARGTSSENYAGQGVDLGVVAVTVTVDEVEYSFIIKTRAARENEYPLAGILYASLVSGGLTDVIGLSVDDYLSIDTDLRSIFYSDENTKRTDADIYDLAKSSQYLNMGTMIGSAEWGILLYKTGTAESILTTACGVAGVTYGEQFYDFDVTGKSVFGTPDIGAYER